MIALAAGSSFFENIAPGSPAELVWRWGCRNPMMPR